MHAQGQGASSRRRGGKIDKQDSRPKQFHGGGSVSGGASSVGSDSTYSRALNSSRTAAIERSLFLAVYSMLSSNSLKDKIQTLAFIVEPIQLLATNFAITAAVAPALSFNPDTHVVSNFIAEAARLVSNPFTGSNHFATSLIDFWICMALTALTLLTFAYVGYRLSFSSTSPETALLALRVVAMVEATVLFMPSVEVFMRYMLVHSPNGSTGQVEYIAFPGEQVDLGLVIGSWVLFLLFFPCCVFIATVAVDVQGVFGQSHGRAELSILVIKLLLVLTVQLTPITGVLVAALIKVFLALVLLWTMLRFMSYNVLMANQFRTGGIMMFVWVSLVEAVAAIGLVTTTAGDFFLLGVIPAAMFGSYLASRRWRSVTDKMPSAGRLWELVEQEDKYDRVLKAKLVLDTPTDLDIAARHVLTPSSSISGFIRDKNDLGILHLFGFRVGTAGSEADGSPGVDSGSEYGASRGGLRRGPDVAQVGDGRLVRMGDDERHYLVHWLYQRAVSEQGDTSRLWAAYFNFVHWANTGSRMRMSAAALARINSLDLRFAVFRYLFEKRRSQVGQGQSTVRYLDLSKSMRTATVYHSKAFREIKTFWKTLVQQGQRISLDKVRSSLHRIGVAERLASVAFAGLISKHSYSTQVLRSYATFLTQVRNNPLEAERFIAMADMVEEEAATERAAALSHQLGKTRSHDNHAPRSQAPPQSHQFQPPQEPRQPQHHFSVNRGDSGRSGAIQAFAGAVRPFGAGSAAGSGESGPLGAENSAGDSGPGGSKRGDVLGLEAAASRGVAGGILKHPGAAASAGSDQPSSTSSSNHHHNDDDNDNDDAAGGDVDSTEAVDPDAGQGLAAELAGRGDITSSTASDDVMGALAATAAKGGDDAETPTAAAVGNSLEAGVSMSEPDVTAQDSFGGATGLQAGLSNADTDDMTGFGGVASASAAESIGFGGGDEAGRSTPVRSAMKRPQAGWGSGSTGASGSTGGRRRRVSIALGDGTVATPGEVVHKAVEEAARGGEKAETALYGAAMEAVTRDTMRDEAAKLGYGDDDEMDMADALDGLDMDEDEDEGDERDGGAGGGAGGGSKRRRRMIHTIGTAEIDSEESSPRSWPGIRYLRLLLGASVFSALVFVTLPIGMNIDLLGALRRTSGAAATGARRETLLWTVGSMLGEMEGGRFWAEYNPQTPTPNGTRLAPTLEELAGELVHVNHRLIFCNSPADVLESYADYVNDASLLSCPPGVESTTSVTTSVMGESYDVISNGLDNLYEIGPEATIGIARLPRLADELAQQIQYQLVRAVRNPIELRPEVYIPLTLEYGISFQQALANMSAEMRQVAIAEAAASRELISQELLAAVALLYNLYETTNTMAEATRALEAESESFDQQFLLVLIIITVLSVVSFAALPSILLRGLYDAHFEQMLGWYILEAVPRQALIQALRTAEGETEDEVTEATDMKRTMSFEDIDELRGGIDGSGKKGSSKRGTKGNKPGVSRYGTLGYDINPESAIARALRKVEKRVCNGDIHVKRKLPSLVRLTSQIQQSRRSLGAKRLSESGVALAWGESVPMGRAISDRSVDASGLHAFRLSDAAHSSPTMHGSLLSDGAKQSVPATTILPAGTTDATTHPSVAQSTAFSVGHEQAAAAAATTTTTGATGGEAGGDSKVAPKMPPIVVAGAASASRGISGAARGARGSDASEGRGAWPGEHGAPNGSASTAGGGFTPRDQRPGLDGSTKLSQGAASRRPRSGCCGRHRRVVDPLVAVLIELKKSSRGDPAYKSSRRRVMILGGIVAALVLICMSVLITTYTRVVMINRKFNAMGRYLVAFSRSGFESTVRRARANNQTTWATVVSAGAGRELFKAWYVQPLSSSGDGTVESSLTVLRGLADELEAYHRCVVFGCQSLPVTGLPVDGISTSPTISEWFFGERAIDEAFRTYTSQLRNQPDEAPATYAMHLFEATRALPRIYSVLWDEWADTYFIVSIVVMIVLATAVLAVGGFFAKSFLSDTTVEVREWRFILGLLPPGVLAKVPLGLSYMSTTEWTSLESTADADEFNIIDEDQQQI